MTFRIRGLDSAPFRHLYGLSDAGLAVHGARRVMVDSWPGYPERIEMRDLAPGETAILVNYTHQPADTPYRSSHAVFVREGATDAYEAVGEVPEVIRRRTISLRAFDAAGNIVEADLVEGVAIEPMIDRFLANAQVAYLHAHYAKYGCYAALIERFSPRAP